jgi:hypothetical protein
MTRLEGFIDHFERDFAVIKRADRTLANVARHELPKCAREGDFIVEANSPCHFFIDRKTTELRRAALRFQFEAQFD